VEIPKDQIISYLESRGQTDQAQQAQDQLPDQVDHEDHADLLHQIGVNPQELVSNLGNAL
jgi:hypothetical protein